MKLARYVKFREEKFGGVLFETRSEKVFALNPTASAIVREIASSGRDEGALLAQLKERFEGNKDTIEREVGAFLGELRSRELIED
jgi:PqqD family protein of HPr-rel-A system